MNRLVPTLNAAKRTCQDCERLLPIEEFYGVGGSWDKDGHHIQKRCGLCRRTNWKAKMMARESIKQGNRDDR